VSALASRLCGRDKPANAEPADVDDEVLSSIGRDLLTLVERPAREGGVGRI
jgi:hypothetical protein